MDRRTRSLIRDFHDAQVLGIEIVVTHTRPELQASGRSADDLYRQMGAKILVIDDEPGFRPTLERVLAELGHEAVFAADGADAIARLRSYEFDLCLTSLTLPKTEGYAVLETARACRPSVPTVVLCGGGTVTAALAALRAGATDFLPRPFHPTLFRDIIQRVVDERWTSSLARRTKGAALIGEHAAMRLALERLAQVAATEAHVLIRGEAGTGKEAMGRLIHASSGRRPGPFVTANLRGRDEAALDVELFGGPGHDGKLAAAQGGTLFLVEIGELPPALQAKLLSAINERELPGASGGRIPLDVRVVAASSRSLEPMVRDGEFLADLYYRLNVIPIELPALRDRPEDIALLAEHFRREANAREGRSVPPFSDEVLARFASYDWPGNVRQLESTIDRVVAAAKNRMVTLDDLPTNLRTDVNDLGPALVDLPPYGVDLRLLLTQLEDRLIGQALQRTGGNKNRAAELLGLNRTTLVEKLRRRNVA